MTERQNQLRYDTGKPRLSYLLAQTPDAAVALFGGDMPWSDLVETLSLYMRDDISSNEALCEIASAAKAQGVGLDLCTEVARVYEYGEGKYARGNYLLGQTVSHYLDSAARHLLQLCRGETHDPESGKHHLAHIWWNVERSGDQDLDRDDRLFKGNKNLGKPPTEPQAAPKVEPAVTIKVNGENVLSRLTVPQW